MRCSRPAEIERVEIRAGACVASLAQQEGRCTGVVAAGQSIPRSTSSLRLAASRRRSPANRSLSFASIPTRPVRGQMLALRRQGLGLQRVLRSERGYLVPRSDGRIVAGSTLEEAGFDKRVTAAGVRHIMESVHRTVPGFSRSGDPRNMVRLAPRYAGRSPHPRFRPERKISSWPQAITATEFFSHQSPPSSFGTGLIHGRTSFDTQAFSPSRFQSAKRELAMT